MLTPSSNTVLEPVTAAMLRDLPEVSAHFGRFEVTEISLGDRALAQFDMAPMLEAARLLGHAKVDAIAWNGTSAAWLGLERDRTLCAQITATTGIPATSSMLALHEIMAAQGIRRLGLATPYLADVQNRIIANLAKSGVDVVAEGHLGISVNFDFALVGEARLEQLIRQAAGNGAQAVAIVCTNLAAAPLVERLEQELGIPIYDSIAITVWAAARAANVPGLTLQGWGRLLAG